MITWSREPLREILLGLDGFQPYGLAIYYDHVKSLHVADQSKKFRDR